MPMSLLLTPCPPELAAALQAELAHAHTQGMVSITPTLNPGPHSRVQDSMWVLTNVLRQAREGKGKSRVISRLG